jgi:hypothetical protein
VVVDPAGLQGKSQPRAVAEFARLAERIPRADQSC